MHLSIVFATLLEILLTDITNSLLISKSTQFVYNPLPISPPLLYLSLKTSIWKMPSLDFNTLFFSTFPPSSFLLFNLHHWLLYSWTPLGLWEYFLSSILFILFFSWCTLQSLTLMMAIICFLLNTCHVPDYGFYIRRFLTCLHIKVTW